MVIKDIAIKVPGSKASFTTYFLETPQGALAYEKPLVIVVPGGGYNYLSAREGEPIALKMNALGYHACVLRYSVSPARYPQALTELAWIVAWVRGNAEQYGIDASHIAVAGFSAGGHLAACLGAFWDSPWLAKAVGVDGETVKPNALLLGYPVITSGEYAHRGSFEHLCGGDGRLASSLSIECAVTNRMPPAFIWHTFDDEKVPVENSLLLAGAMSRAGVPCALHVFSHGEHGSALATRETAFMGSSGHIVVEIQVWPQLFQTWFSSLSL